MRISLILLLTVVILCPAIDVYIWSALGRLRNRPSVYRIARVCQISISVAAYAIALLGLLLPRTGGSDSVLVAKMWLLFAFITVYMSKALFVVVDLVSQIPVIFRRRRWKCVTVAGIVLSVLLFLGMWYGALVNRFNLQVREVEVEMGTLPNSFDGYRIVQISDFHTGTYGSDTSFVSRVVDEINSLRPDLVVFTGDIVNRNSHEIDPHIAPLSKICARDGVFAILGNHDYGDYYDWPSREAKEDNMEYLYHSFKEMGWTLLRNSTEFIRAGADSIALIGVENIGDPPFPSYGSLERAYPKGADGVAKILLSHNPAHWTNDIKNGSTANDIGLTLSGHTHAMQMELFGLSPAYFRYPTWGGLYRDSEGRNLYVNIGLGAVGIPMRLGATPEITVLTLRKAATH